LEKKQQKIFFGTNLKFLRERKKISQEALAGQLGITRAKLAAIESGQTKAPQPEDYLNFSAFFRISVDTLLKVDLTTIGELKLRELEAGNDVYIKGGNLRVLAISVDKSNNENVEYVPVKAKAGYASGGYSDPEYIAGLPKFSMPNLPRNGTFRIFPITGDSMLPIPDGSEVTGKFVEDWRTLKPDTPCIVILNGNQDFVFKLVTLAGDLFRLRSLNPLYAPYEVPVSEVLEIWSFHSFISREMPQHTDLSVVLNEIRKLRFAGN